MATLKLSRNYSSTPKWKVTIDHWECGENFAFRLMAILLTILKEYFKQLKNPKEGEGVSFPPVTTKPVPRQPFAGTVETIVMESLLALHGVIDYNNELGTLCTPDHLDVGVEQGIVELISEVLVHYSRSNFVVRVCLNILHALSSTYFIYCLIS